MIKIKKYDKSKKMYNLFNKSKNMKLKLSVIPVINTI